MCPLRTFLKKIPSIIHFVHKNIVGARVRKARKESKITQTELAARLQVLGVNIERPAISKLESGNRPVTDIEVAAIAKALEVPISWLFEE
jgi:transcriptional regulator with XRE-family HTH domain